MENVLPEVGFVGYSSAIWIEGLSNRISKALLLLQGSHYELAVSVYMIYRKVNGHIYYLSLVDKDEKCSHA